jgi:hypothetical protein
MSNQDIRRSRRGRVRLRRRESLNELHRYIVEALKREGFTSPPKLIRKFLSASPSGFLSMSSAPAIPIVEDLEAALAQFAEIASDLKK